MMTNAIHIRGKEDAYYMEQKLKRYDVILVDFGEETFESEQAGIRPAVIIQNDVGNFFSRSTIVMPLSKQFKNPNQPTHTLIRKERGNGLICDSMLLGECMRQISEKRIIKFLGTITNYETKKEIRRVYDANFGE